MAIVFHKKGCNGWFDWEDRGGVVRFIEAVSGGVAQFAPEGPLPHISEAFRRVGIERRSGGIELEG